MTTNRSLDELPSDVFVALGRRGMEPIPLKECTYECSSDETDLVLIEVTSNPEKIKKEGVEEQTENWRVRCIGCNREFTIQCLIRFVDGERMDTKVNIIDDQGRDLGWLGSY